LGTPLLLVRFNNDLVMSRCRSEVKTNTNLMSANYALSNAKYGLYLALLLLCCVMYTFKILFLIFFYGKIYQNSKQKKQNYFYLVLGNYLTHHDQIFRLQPKDICSVYSDHFSRPVRLRGSWPSLAGGWRRPSPLPSSPVPPVAARERAPARADMC
jgi:hypothetical protein